MRRTERVSSAPFWFFPRWPRLKEWPRHPAAVRQLAANVHVGVHRQNNHGKEMDHCRIDEIVKRNDIEI